MGTIPDPLQPRALLAHPKALGPHLRTLLTTDPSIEKVSSINACILHQVHTEAISPAVYEIWLSLTWHSFPHFVTAALQDPSNGVREAAVNVVRRRLFRVTHWKERGWDALGGARGIKDILDKLPLAEVRCFVKAIFGRCDVVPDRDLVSACVEEFLALVEDTDCWASRTLLPYVSYLYAYCSAEKVVHLLQSQSPMCSAFIHYLPRFHIRLLRRIAVGAVVVPVNVRFGILQRCQRSLLCSREAYDPVYYQDEQPAMSPGLLFGMDLLMAIQKELENTRYENYKLHRLVKSIVEQGIHDKSPFESILLVLSQGLATLQANEWVRRTDLPNDLSRSFRRDLIQFWSISRFGRVGSSHEGLAATYQRKRRLKEVSNHKVTLEHLIIEKVLPIWDDELDVRQRHLRFAKTVAGRLSLVAEKGRLELLQLFCRHSPNLEFDLTVWPPSKKEQELIPCWHTDILHVLPPNDSHLLFKRALHNHNCKEFLTKSGDSDASLKLPSWSEQCLLWATWESAGSAGREEHAFPISRRALDEIKQNSVRAREPPERLQWAKSAVELAVRTGSVDIFAEIVKWTNRFIRDPMVFPDLLREVINCCKGMLSCESVSLGAAPVPKDRLLQEAQTGHQVLEDLLRTLLLLLREPWARNSMAKITETIPSMLSTIVGHRMRAVRKRSCGESVSEAKLVGAILDPMIPLLLEYEREGNTEGQENLEWRGPSGMIRLRCLPGDPNAVELSFMDRLAKDRDEYWQQHRAQQDPKVLELSVGWPRGLPIQNLVDDPIWLFHAMQHQDHAPFISSRASQLLFSAADILMMTVGHKTNSVGVFVDDLQFVMCALLANDNQEDKVRDILRVWEHYSRLLQPHSVYLSLFRDWLVDMIPKRKDMAGVISFIRPPIAPVRPTVLAVPAGPDPIKWDPHGGDYPRPGAVIDDERSIEVKKPDEILCTLLCCRLKGKVPSSAPFVPSKRPEPQPERLSIWSSAFRSLSENSQDFSYCVQDSVVLAALLYLDTFTKNPGILRTKFPDVDFPRYTPVYLADEFIAFQAGKRHSGELKLPIKALRSSAKRVPAQILRDLIWSFMDTMQAEPNAPTYPSILYGTFDLIKVLLSTDKPYLAVDIMIRVWMDFPNESSLHRRVSLAQLGRILTPEEAGKMMWRFAGLVCEALQTQESQSHSQSQNQQQVEGVKSKKFIKVTTAKMLAQALAQADFLSQSDQMQMLQRMFNSTHHIDIRTAIVTALLELVESSDSVEPYKVFASIASSIAGPNERAATIEVEWKAAENEQGPLPDVSPDSERPILDLVVSAAASKVPESLRSDYVRNVLLPLLQESTRQHTRWMTALIARLGLSISDLGISESEIGPFALDLTDKILHKWRNYLPGSYLQTYHRTWSLSYLHYESFRRINQALAEAPDGVLKRNNTQRHWDHIINSQRARPALFRLGQLLLPRIKEGSKASDGLNATLILDEFVHRAEAVARNPVKYNASLYKYTVHPEYTLEPLRALRKSRMGFVAAVKDEAQKVALYDDITRAMTQVTEACKRVRREGWSSTLTPDYPVTLPSKLEYDILTLPSPTYNPTSSESTSISAVEIFASAVVDLICRYSQDPVLLLKLDAFQPVMQDVPAADLKACTLHLGCFGAQSKKHGHNEVVTCTRVKLTRSLLDRMRSSGTRLDEDIQEMIDEWRKSDLEFVRQIGWEYQ